MPFGTPDYGETPFLTCPPGEFREIPTPTHAIPLPPGKSKLLSAFARNGYVIVGKYLPADENNLYFKPLR